jgi:protein arginine kinase activator
MEKDHKCPLTGKPCYRPRPYQITELENGFYKTSFKLCSQCFQEYNEQLEKKTPTPNPKLKHSPEMTGAFLSNLIDFVEKVAKDKKLDLQIPKEGPICPNCKCTVADIVKTNKLGCPECWNKFGKNLEVPLYYAHGMPNSPEILFHTGKIPSHYRPEKPEETKIQKLVKLQYQLAEAVQKEDYETAAKIRDQIKDVEATSSS